MLFEENMSLFLMNSEILNILSVFGNHFSCLNPITRWHVLMGLEQSKELQEKDGIVV